MERGQTDLDQINETYRLQLKIDSHPHTAPAEPEGTKVGQENEREFIHVTFNHAAFPAFILPPSTHQCATHVLTAVVTLLVAALLSGSSGERSAMHLNRVL